MTTDIDRLYSDSDGLGVADLVRRGEVSAAEIFEAAVSAAERVNPRLNAMIHPLYEFGRAAARAVNPDAPFAGVPYLLKESGTPWKGAPLTSAMRWMRNVIASADNEQVRRIKKAGFLLVGKSNAPENGWSITTEPKLYGPTHNPWREDVTPGGSSGGSASGVAAHMVPIAEASDGAGSIRVPASCCGIVGLKPSRGRVTVAPGGDALYGGAYDLCVSRTIRDTAAYLDVIAGPSPGDPYFAPKPSSSWLELAARPPTRLKIGFSLTPPDGSVVHAEVVSAVRRTLDLLAKLGHEIEEHDMVEGVAEIWWTYVQVQQVAVARGFDVRASLVGAAVTPDDVEPATWGIIERGRSITGIQHAADIEAMRVAGRAICSDLMLYDVFVTPTLIAPPRPLGHLSMSEPDIDRYNGQWTDAAFMYPFNISGQPAMSVPVHWSADGLPIGVQLVGRFGDETTLLQLGTVLEKEMPWRDRRPPVCA